MSETTTSSPVVLIAGAGLSGLLLGALLERAGIEYYIFERASKVKPLGSAMVLGPTILAVFEQLGILEDLQKISLEFRAIELHNEKMEKLSTIQMKNDVEIGGYASQLFARPDLYELMLRQVPAEKILMSKKVLKVEEEDSKVHIHCSDGTSYMGDILVGADGAYSAVRQAAYKEMAAEGTLPKEDAADLVAGYTTMVGVTSAVDPEKYPQLKGDHSFFQCVVSGSGQSWGTMCVPGNRICWGFSHQYQSLAEGKKQMFMNSEWGPESNAAMIKDFYDLPCPYGGTMGDLIDATPEDLVSKVYLEHKMFETWYYKRSVLIGDACHKMLPSAGQGALNAMQDAVILANCLYDLKDNTQESITTAFQSYYDQRFEKANAQYQNSQVAAKVLMSATWTDRLIRTIAFKFIPQWIQQKSYEKTTRYRPQVTFLPRAPARGRDNVLPQLPSVRYEKEEQERQKKQREQERGTQGDFLNAVLA
ncbi:hypothetical protein EMPS_03724 [Entomortierella parvispora]|uniref:FAD-binding domain-containing protein n=1 Tax=Entomortierella parvispora TaxID=205924 RepID=A0A9P3H7A3_9FUNG|nr:hypothetical protein EMPS_03724 [Entomortierella parvispora]